MLLILGLLALTVAGVGVAARYSTPGRGWAIGISAFSPYLLLAAPVAAILLLVSRHWWAGIAAIAVTAGCVVIQLPLFVASTAPTHGHTFVTLTANLRLGHGNAGDMVAAVERHQVDALMLQELTIAEQQRLVAAGLDRVLPWESPAEWCRSGS